MADFMDNIPSISQPLIRWYEQNKRELPWRETKDPYIIWISEIILQQTRVVQGYDYFVRFVSRFPDVKVLAEASEDEVMKYWEGLGYYSRARKFACGCKADHGRFWREVSRYLYRDTFLERGRRVLLPRLFAHFLMICRLLF